MEDRPVVCIKVLWECGDDIEIGTIYHLAVISIRKLCARRGKELGVRELRQLKALFGL